jgi:hypothetical protein
MIKTLNQLKQELQIFADAHLQINEFYFGNFNQIYNEKIIRHTFLIADTQNISPNRVRGGGSYTDITFIISACDQVFPDQSNWMDVKSDMFQVIMDCRNIFESPRWKAFSSVQGSPTVTYFEQKGSDRVNGWVMNVTLRIPDLRDLCAIPLVDYNLDSELESLCAGVTIIEDGSYLQTVPSGGTFSYSTGGGGSVIISINGTPYVTEPAPSTINIPVLDTNGDPIGVVDPQVSVVISNSSIEINGVQFESVAAESSLDIPVLNSNGTPIGIVDPHIQLDIEDSFVENSDASYTNQFASATTFILPDITITQKNSANTTIGSDLIPSAISVDVSVVNTPIKNSAGTLQDNAPSGVDYIVRDDKVTNSDLSVTISGIVQGITNVLPDITVTSPNGSTASYPSIKNYACTLISALATQDLNDDLTPTQINQIQRQQPTRSGQLTSFRTGDDGDLEMGIGASFSTLSDNNIFGNTSRFTSELGNQTYTNNFVLDHSTGLMWYIALTTATQWNGAIDGALASTQGTFTDWILPNINQLVSICNFSTVTNALLNYSPFNIAVTTSTDRIWTSTTLPNSTASAYTLQSNSTFAGSGKSTSQSYIICRKFIPSDFGL